MGVGVREGGGRWILCYVVDRLSEVWTERRRGVRDMRSWLILVRVEGEVSFILYIETCWKKVKIYVRV